jgi:hypothetical protein
MQVVSFLLRFHIPQEMLAGPKSFFWGGGGLGVRIIVAAVNTHQSLIMFFVPSLNTKITIQNNIFQNGFGIRCKDILHTPVVIWKLENWFWMQLQFCLQQIWISWWLFHAMCTHGPLIQKTKYRGWQNWIQMENYRYFKSTTGKLHPVRD